MKPGIYAFPDPSRKVRDPIAGARTAHDLLLEARWRLGATFWRYAPTHGAPLPVLEALLAGCDITAVLADAGIPATEALLVALRRELEPEWS